MSLVVQTSVLTSGFSTMGTDELFYINGGSGNSSGNGSGNDSGNYPGPRTPYYTPQLQDGSSSSCGTGSGSK